jgi:hypothetical protein
MRPILLPVFICAIVLTVAGCGGTVTGAQQEVARMQSVAAEYKASGDACVQNIAGNPDYAPLKAKTSLDAPPQFSLQMLNDKTSPNKQEVSLLYRVYGDSQGCHKIFLDGAANMHPLILSVLVENYSNSDKLWAQVTAGGLTWGQFNQGRKDLFAQGQEKLAQANAQIGSQLQSENQAELAQQQQARAAAIASMQEGLKRAGDAYANMPLPAPPRTIQCNTVSTGAGTSSSICQ